MAAAGGGNTNPPPPVDPTTPPPPPTPEPPSFSDVTAEFGIGFDVGYTLELSNVEVELVAPSGVAAGDFADDGLIDLVIVRGDVSANLLYRNLGDLQFSEVASQAGIAWRNPHGGNLRHGSPGLVELDGDNDLDLFLPGMCGDPSRLYHTNGWTQVDEFGAFSEDASRAFVSDGQGSFEETASELGLDDTYNGRGVVCADLDNDGDVDILQLHTSTEASATLWRNDSQGNNYLSVKLRGLAPYTGAMGARITLCADEKDQMREVVLGSNYLSHNPVDQYFGLSVSDRIETLTVEWPDGSETLMQDLEVNQRLTIDHPRL